MSETYIYMQNLAGNVDLSTSLGVEAS